MAKAKGKPGFNVGHLKKMIQEIPDHFLINFTKIMVMPDATGDVGMAQVNTPVIGIGVIREEEELSFVIKGTSVEGAQDAGLQYTLIAEWSDDHKEG